MLLRTNTTMKIVVCGGCFDVLHGGHITLLKEARKLGDILLVLVNDDAYVARKGPQRPILSLEERMAILRELRCVSVVIPFSDETPCRMLELIEPDIFVKGSEYEGMGIVEEAAMREVGGKVVYIDSGIETHSGNLVAVL